MTHQEFKAKIAAINADFELQLAAYYARMETVYAETSKSLDALESICSSVENNRSAVKEVLKAYSA